jgi:hypothetical protein
MTYRLRKHNVGKRAADINSDEASRFRGNRRDAPQLGRATQYR